jgi:hypothetical protein
MNSTQTLNFDSLYSSYTNIDPFDTTFNLSSAISKSSKIRLASVELPLGFNNIRSSNYSNTLTMTIGSTSSTITLSSAYYSSASTLCTAINNAFTALSLINTPTFSVSGNYIIVTLNSSATYSITNGVLANNALGFSKSTSGTGTSFTAGNAYNLSYDTYIVMYFPNLPVNNNSAGNQMLHFKLPISGVNGALYYYYEGFGFHQELQVTDTSYIISNLKVQFFDRFGFQITSNSGLDYSFSLSIDYFQ